MFTIFSTKRKSLLAVTCALALALGAVGGGLAVSANAKAKPPKSLRFIPLAKYEFLDAETRKRFYGKLRPFPASG